MKKTICLLLSLLMVCSMLPMASAASDEAIEAANALYELGLFTGTGTDVNGKPIFDLDRAPTRAEGVTMLVRLLGKESEAKAGTWSTPFTDVADWAKPYVGFAYTNGVTDGISATLFAGEKTITASQYLTFVLRALGYTSGTDFQWDKAWELSDKLGFTSGQYNAGTTDFTRGDVAIISYHALSATIKDTQTTLESTLGLQKYNTPENLKGIWLGQGRDYNEEFVFSGSDYTCARIWKDDGDVSFCVGEYSFDGSEFRTLCTHAYTVSQQSGSSEVRRNELKKKETIKFIDADTFTHGGVTYERVSGTVLTPQVQAVVGQVSPPAYGLEKSGEEYAYLAASDFRRVRREYSSSVATGGYVCEFTNSDGDDCVLTIVQYRIISLYSVVTLHNLTTGAIIEDPNSYYQEYKDRAYGETKLHYIELQLETNKHLADMWEAFTDVSKTGKNTGMGTYVTAQELNL